MPIANCPTRGAHSLASCTFLPASAAKRAYLRALCVPPPSIFEASPVAVIRPYDGPAAQSIIQNVNARHASSASRSHNARGSVSIPNGNGHGRMASTSIRNGNNGGSGIKLSNGPIPEHPTSINTNGTSSSGREPSPTLPDVPSHATLSAMISQSTSFVGEEAVLNDPAVVSSSEHGAPRIGDPGKRMIGAALGVRHPGLGPRNLNGGEHGLTKAMGGLTVAE